MVGVSVYSSSGILWLISMHAYSLPPPPQLVAPGLVGTVFSPCMEQGKYTYNFTPENVHTPSAAALHAWTIDPNAIERNI